MPGVNPIVGNPIVGLAPGNNLINNSAMVPIGPNAVDFFYFGTLPAKDTAGFTSTIPLSGNNFSVYASNGLVTIAPGNGVSNSYDVGTGLDLRRSGGGFQTLVFTNLNAFPISFVIFIGFNDLIDKRSYLVAPGSGAGFPFQWAATVPVGSNITKINANATLSFPGTGQAGLRKQIVFKNLDANLVLQVLDKDSKLFDTILPQQDWTFESSGIWILKNPNGSDVNCNAGETFFAASV